MKRIFAILLAAAMIFGLAACSGDDSGDNRVISRKDATADVTAAPGGDNTTAASAADYTFVTPEGVRITPGQPFDSSALAAAESVYQVQSCAIEGTDNVYNYGDFEVTAFDEGNGEYVYSVYIVTPSASTGEGLSLGDDEARVDELYGGDFTAAASGRVYVLGETKLQLTIEKGTVTGIEYLLNR